VVLAALPDYETKFFSHDIKSPALVTIPAGDLKVVAEKRTFRTTAPSVNVSFSQVLLWASF
jgi:hypothetical protein